MPKIITGFFSLIGNALGYVAGFKSEQAKTLSNALEVISSRNATDTAEMNAASAIIVAEMSNNGALSNWRAFFMVLFGTMIVVRYFGYVAPNVSEAELMRMYDMFEMGLMGYIGISGTERIAKSLGIMSVLKTFISKKLV